MAADPSAVDPFIDPVTTAAQLLEDELLGIIAAGVAAGLSTVAIRARLVRRVQMLAPGVLAAAGQAIVDSFTAGVQAADEDVRATRKVRERRAPSPKPLRLLLGRVLKEAPRLMGRTIDLANLAIKEALAADRFGTRKAAASALLARYAADGVTGFQDASGRRWDLVTYAETVTRTTAVQTLVDAHLQRLTDRGHDLVIVSDTPAECDLCRPYEGKVLSISGGIAKGTKLSDGVRVYDSIAGAKAAGVWHPNCRHRAGIYLPGRTKPFGETRDPQGAKLRDQQRYRERKVREKQRKLLALHAIDPRSDETRAAVADLRAYQKSFAAWRKANGVKNAPARTNLAVR